MEKPEGGGGAFSQLVFLYLFVVFMLSRKQQGELRHRLRGEGSSAGFFDSGRGIGD